MDSAGRIVLPKPIRDRMGLKAGDALAVEASGEQITLRPIQAENRLIKKGNLWVLRSTGGPPMTLEETNDILRKIREERERKLLGEVE